MADTLIIADDLSGAADCAVACAASGAKTVVLLDPSGDPKGAAAVAIDINSRVMPPVEAGEGAARAVKAHHGATTGVLYQKMDSTLRGNWAIEAAHIRAAAARSCGQAPFALVAPAFPATGRTVVMGRAMLHGAPLEDTEIGARGQLGDRADLRTPLEALGFVVDLVTLADIRAGPRALAMQLVRWIEARTDLAVCDAETPGDLETIALASLMLPRRPLYVGSGGLMRALAQADGHWPAPAGGPERGRADKPLLVVVGSGSRVSHEQFEALVRERPVAPLSIAPSALRQRGAVAEAHAYDHALAQSLVSGSDLAIRIDPSEGVELQEGQHFTSALAQVLAPHLHGFGGLIATGGETARALLTRSGVGGLHMQGEIETGVPLAVALGDVAIPVVTKAGAFGDRATLIRCYDALRGDGSDTDAAVGG